MTLAINSDKRFVQDTSNQPGLLTKIKENDKIKFEKRDEI